MKEKTISKSIQQESKKKVIRAKYHKKNTENRYTELISYNNKLKKKLKMKKVSISQDSTTNLINVFSLIESFSNDNKITLKQICRTNKPSSLLQRNFKKKH